MTERWGTCRACSGQGSVPERDPVTHKIKHYISCGHCRASPGFSNDAMEEYDRQWYEDYSRDRELRMTHDEIGGFPAYI